MGDSEMEIITFLLQALRPYRKNEKFIMVFIVSLALIMEKTENKNFKKKLIEFLNYSDEKGENA